MSSSHFCKRKAPDCIQNSLQTCCLVRLNSMGHRFCYFLFYSEVLSSSVMLFISFLCLFSHRLRSSSVFYQLITPRVFKSLPSPLSLCACSVLPLCSCFFLFHLPVVCFLALFLVCTSLFCFCFAFVSWVSPMLLSPFLLLHFGFFELAVQLFVIRSHFSLIVIIIVSWQESQQARKWPTWIKTWG